MKPQTDCDAALSPRRSTFDGRLALMFEGFNAPQMRRDASLIRRALRTRPARVAATVLIGFSFLSLTAFL